MFDNLATSAKNETFDLGNLGYSLQFRSGSNVQMITGELQIVGDKKWDFYTMLLGHKYALDEKNYKAINVEEAKIGDTL